MSQNDLVIANQTFPATRADITSALQALGSTNSGATAPSTTYANMMWYDTTSHILKLRSEANDVWINIGYVDQSSDTFKILDDTTVATTSGTTAGLLGDQATGVWQAGTGNTESLVSPAKVKAAVDALTPEPIGVNQTWQSPSRYMGTVYQNTTGKPIQVSIATGAENTIGLRVGATSGSLSQIASCAYYSSMQCIIPDQYYYEVYNINGGNVQYWYELRS